MAEKNDRRRQHVVFEDFPNSVVLESFLGNLDSEPKTIDSDIQKILQKPKKSAPSGRRHFVESISSDLKILDSDSDDAAEKPFRLPSYHRKGPDEHSEDSNSCANHLVDSDGVHYRLLKPVGSQLQLRKPTEGIPTLRGNHQNAKPPNDRPIADDRRDRHSTFPHQREVPLPQSDLCQMSPQRRQMECQSSNCHFVQSESLHQHFAESEDHGCNSSSANDRNDSIQYSHHYMRSQHQHLDLEDSAEPQPGCDHGANQKPQRSPWIRLCAVCKQKAGAETIVFLDGTLYHARCFACSTCKQAFNATDRFYSLDGDRQLCIPCYRAHFAPRCLGCNEGIVEECVRVGPNQHYHPMCFRCVDCKKQLTDEFRRENNGQPLCQNCFWMWRLSRFVAHEKQLIMNEDP